MKTNNVLFIIAGEGYQQHEYRIPKKIVEAHGITVTTASSIAKIATSSDGEHDTVDTIINTINPEAYDGLFLVGGPGALEHLNTKKIHTLIQAFATAKKPFGAICISTRILAYAQVLAGRTVTGWNDDAKLNDILHEARAIYLPHDVVIDDNLVTAVGPRSAEQYGNAIVTVLTKP